MDNMQRWGEYVRDIETQVMVGHPGRFAPAVGRTRQDHLSGMISHSGQSMWMERIEGGYTGRHVCESSQGIWIVRDENMMLCLYLSYSMGTHWVIDLSGSFLHLSSDIDSILRSSETKHVRFRDDRVGIWRDVYSWEDVVRLPG